jgi:HPr kinase/phosphorylase
VSDTLLMHATAVAIDGEAILLRGPPGSGKSDLALRLIDAGAQLVADDQTLLRRERDRVIATAPPAIAGLLEIRGIGVVRVAVAEMAPLLMIAELTTANAIERMPQARFETVLGLAVPLLALAAFEASAAAKLRFLRRALAAGPLPVIMGA